MIIETFRNFIEIEGLNQKVAQHIVEIAGQEKRLVDAESKKQAAILKIDQNHMQIKTLKLKELELTVSGLEKKLAQYQEQMNLVKNQKELDSINHEISTISTQLKTEENDFFIKIDLASNLENEIVDLQNFVKGIDESIIEIKVEVEKEIAKNQSEINNYQLRINSLLDQLSPSDKNMYLELAKKFKTSKPTAFINGKNCSACRINIDAQTINMVDHAKSLELCPNCSRLLLPNNLNLY